MKLAKQLTNLRSIQLGFEIRRANILHLAGSDASPTASFQDAVSRFKASLFYKALYGSLLVLCFGLAVPSVRAQTQTVYNSPQSYPVNGATDVTVQLENNVTSICGVNTNLAQGNFVNYSGQSGTVDYLQVVSSIPLSNYFTVRRGLPFNVKTSCYSTNFGGTTTVKAYIGSENSPTTLVYQSSATGAFQCVNPEFTAQFPQGASKGWLVIEAEQPAFLITKKTRLILPFVVTGVKDDVAILGQTTSPQIPYLVVHAPPGDKSTSSFTATGRNCRSFEQTQTTDKSTTGDLAIKVGVSGSIGFIAMINYELSTTFSFTSTRGNLKVQNTSKETCTEVTNSFSTDGLYSNGNKTSDLFIGYGVDENYGIGDFYEINPTTCQVELKRDLVLQPIESTVREFRLTEEGIQSDMATQQSIIDNPNSSNKAKAIATAQKKVWQQVLDQNNANKSDLSQRLTGVNFSAGASGSTTTATESTASSSLNVERYVEGSTGISFIATFGATGAFGGATFNTSQRYGTTNTTTSGQRTELSYTLSDDDQGDQFSVDVYRDKQYGTPFFKLGGGSKTSCPYEGGYQLDQPNLKGVGVTGSNITVNAPAGNTSASFELQLCNNSNVDRSYVLNFNSKSNGSNALITALGSAGFTLSQPISVPANGCNPPIRVDVARRDANSLFSFQNLEFQLQSTCGDQSSSFFATANFSAAVSVTVSAPSVTTQQVCQNATPVDIAVTGSGGTGNLTYQWYVNTTANNTGGTLVANATTATFTPPTNVAGTRYYYCVVSCASGCTAVPSATSQVTITAASGSVNSPTICAGNTATLTATGGTSYVWGHSAETTASVNVSPSITTNYPVTVTNANGCAVNLVATVTVVTSLPVTINGPTAGICVGSSATLTASGGKNYTWSTTATTPSVTVTPTGTTTYSVTATDGGCSGTANVTVTVNPLSTITVNSPNTCAGVATTLTASGGVNYLWSTNETTPSVSVSPVGTTTYTVTGTDAKGCSNTANATVTVNPKPNINVNNPTVCAGSTATLTATGGVSYVWSTGATGNTLTVNAPLSTTTPDTYTVTGTDANGCSNTVTATVRLGTAVTATVNNATICAGSPAVLTASGGVSYSWSTNGSTPSITVNPTTTTDYTVTVTNRSGCTAVATATVTVKAAPNLSVNNPTICSGETAVLTASGGSTYAWSTGATTPSVSVSPSATVNYTVTVTDANGCSNTATATVTVNALPIASVNSPTICAGTSATLVASGGSTYAWSTGANTPSVSVSPIVTTNYTVTVTNSNGCSSTATATVTVNALPVASVNSPTICAGTSATLVASGGSTYAWSTGASGNVITVNPTKPSSYSVTVTNANGCSSTTTATVTVNALPVASVNSPTICVGSSATLTTSGGTSYLWSNGANTPSVSVSPSATANYTVTVTDANGCSNTTTATVTVNATPIVGLNSLTICPGSNATLIASGGSTYNWSTGASGNVITVNPTTTSSYSVTVTAANGCSGTASTVVNVNSVPTVSLNNPVICAGANATLVASGGSTYAWSTGASGSVIAVNPTTTSSYSVTVTSANGCSTTASAVVTVNSAPSVGLNNPVICAGSNATLVASGGSTFAWSNGASGNVITVNPTTTSGYSVTVTNANGCSSTASAVVTVNALPNLGVTNAAICAGTNATLTATGALSYLWNTGSTSNQITVSPTNTTNYTVTGTDGNGCKATGTATVILNPSVNLVVNNPTICAGANATLVATGGTSYLWSTGSLSSVVTVNPTTSTTYWVMASNSFGCSSTATATVTVNALPRVNVPSVAICSGSSTNLLATGAVNYQWSTGATSNSIFVNPTTTTNYSVNGTDANGCSNTAVASISINPLPVIRVNSPTICTGSNATLTASGGINYLWSTNATTPSVSVSPTTSTDYMVTVTNANGCSNAATATVTVNALPVASVNSPTICPTTSATLTASGGISYLWSTNATTPSVSVSPTTTTNYTVTVTNANGCSSTASSVVTILIDTEKPVITCPASLSINTDANVCGALATFATATATDNCSAIVTQTGGLTSGSLFPVGTNSVTFTATDKSGNTSTCSFTVRVTDNEKPVITTNGDKSMNNDVGKCGATVAVSASATDNCSVGTPTGVRSDGAALTALYPVGTTTITWNVTDVNGNAAVAIQTVKVTDKEKPVITSNGDKSVNNDAGKCGATVAVSASTTDNCSVGTPTGVRSDGAALTALYPVGTTTITWNVTDVNGNAAVVVVQTVKVTNTEKPVIISNGDKSVNNDAGKCGATVAVSASATDNCSVGAPTGVRSDGAALTALYPIGTTTITWNVTDVNGNSAVAVIQTVKVTNTEKPVITTNGDKSVNNDAGKCGATVAVSASATDNCSVGTPTGVRSDGAALTALYPVGTTTITWNVTDVNGNAAVAIQTVKVTDNEAPKITCPAGITKTSSDVGNCGAKVTFANATATDNCSATVIQTTTYTSGQVFSVGNTTVTFKATDPSGNSSSCSFTITVSSKATFDPTVCYNILNNGKPIVIDALNAFLKSPKQTQVQSFKIIALPNGNIRILSSSDRSGKLSLYDPAPGSNVQAKLQNYSTNNLQSDWLINCVNGSYVITHQGSGQVLTVGATTNDGKTPVVVAAANGSSNQSWTFQAVACPVLSNDFESKSISNLSGYAGQQRNVIDFTTNQGLNTDYYTAEKLSRASGNFEVLEQRANTEVTDKVKFITFYDNAPYEGDNFYRVKSTFLDGTSAYTNVQQINTRVATDFTVFPNPTDEEAWIDLKAFAGKEVTLTVSDLAGKTLQSEVIKEATTEPHHLDLSRYTTGFYFIKVQTAGRQIQTKKLQVAK